MKASIPPSYVYADGEIERAQAVNMICAVCRSPPVLPIAHASCGSMGCKTCFSSLIACVHCKGALPPNELSHVTVMPIVLLLQSLKVICPGCNVAITRAAFDEHVQDCPVPCPRGCGEKIRPATASLHDALCGLVEIKCTAFGCNSMLPRQDMTQHQASCPFVLLEPAFQMILERMRRLEEMATIAPRPPPTEDVPQLLERLGRLEEVIATITAMPLDVENRNNVRVLPRIERHPTLLAVKPGTN